MMDRANDLVEFRIEAVLHEMSVTTLCELPDEEPWTIDKFLERTQVTDYSRIMYSLFTQCVCTYRKLMSITIYWYEKVNADVNTNYGRCFHLVTQWEINGGK